MNIRDDLRWLCQVAQGLDTSEWVSSLSFIILMVALALFPAPQSHPTSILKPTAEEPQEQ
ncbi:hypothetical protein [Epibacterium ulvae]|uniref:hypothetical protein n=1 Tax=Epibacterium ulvae TaxID=1156985 RepID=UPI0024916375|nr:hypothetical protein [Epibacterium ulvae]